jgi:hypothetical protein
MERANVFLNGAGPAKHIRPVKTAKGTMEAREKIEEAKRGGGGRQLRSYDGSVAARRPERWPVLHCPPSCDRVW